MRYFEDSAAEGSAPPTSRLIHYDPTKEPPLPPLPRLALGRRVSGFVAQRMDFVLTFTLYMLGTLAMVRGAA